MDPMSYMQGFFSPNHEVKPHIVYNFLCTFVVSLAFFIAEMYFFQNKKVPHVRRGKLE